MDLFVVGAGHVGLVSAVGLARLGHRVTVADVDSSRIEGLRAGDAPIFEPGLEDRIREQAVAGRLDFTTDLAPPAGVGWSIVAVPTPTGPEGPLSTKHVEEAVAVILDATAAGHTIVVRSTLPLEGPDRLVALRAGRPDAAAIVTNPEFMREGSGLADFDRPGRIIIGWLEPRDRAAAEAALSLYDGIDAPTLVADARSVALIKVASNVFLAAKVAFANELARLADAVGADVGVVADGIGLDARIGRAFLNAGPGFGGSCLPEQSLALAGAAARLEVPAPLIDAVHRSNAGHQRAIVARLGHLLRPGGSLRGCRIALLGLAFKANTDDVRESPALALARQLRAAGATVVATDPRAEAKARRADPELMIADSVEEAVDGADAVLVVTEWQEYRTIDWGRVAGRMAGDLVFDTRQVVDGDRVRASGLRLALLGRP